VGGVRPMFAQVLRDRVFSGQVTNLAGRRLALLERGGGGLILAMGRSMLGTSPFPQSLGGGGPTGPQAFTPA